MGARGSECPVVSSLLVRLETQQPSGARHLRKKKKKKKQTKKKKPADYHIAVHVCVCVSSVLFDTVINSLPATSEPGHSAPDNSSWILKKKKKKKERSKISPGAVTGRLCVSCNLPARLHAAGSFGVKRHS